MKPKYQNKLNQNQDFLNMRKYFKHFNHTKNSGMLVITYKDIIMFLRRGVLRINIK